MLWGWVELGLGSQWLDNKYSIRTKITKKGFRVILRDVVNEKSHANHYKFHSWTLSAGFWQSTQYYGLAGVLSTRRMNDEGSKSGDEYKVGREIFLAEFNQIIMDFATRLLCFCFMPGQPGPTLTHNKYLQVPTNKFCTLFIMFFLR